MVQKIGMSIDDLEYDDLYNRQHRKTQRVGHERANTGYDASLTLSIMHDYILFGLRRMAC